jgi:NAD(P)-dependent dehydrogenase (short-subunit alcohol dehydrogenase family)
LTAHRTGYRIVVNETDNTSSTTPSDGAPADPREPSLEVPEQQIEHPGSTADVSPRPDHGEDSYVGSRRLVGRRTLITGGDSGIGRAVAIAFAREGADVAITHLPEERDDAAETVAWIERCDRRALSIDVDVRSHEACRALVEQVADEFGGIDIVVNNAAFQCSVESFESLSPEQVRRTFETNVFATLSISQAAVEHMAPGSAIINTTSIQAFDPSPDLIDYAATKAALVNLTANLAQDLAERGIRVNSVAPGPVWTPLIPATMPPERVESFGTSTPLGRPGQPAEIAPAFVFLACDDARYITGQTLGVTGGRLTL